MKIGVTSLGCRSTRENYGAVLQMWAFKKVVERIHPNSEVMLIDYKAKCLKNSKSKLTELDLKAPTFKGRIKKMIYFPFVRKRYNNIEKFFVKECNRTKDIIEYSGLNTFDGGFDVVIAESDVIWDPTFRSAGFDDMFFLNVPSFKKAKKIVYAASLGDAKFHDDKLDEFKKLTADLKYISVREDYAVDYLAKDFSMDVDKCLDPTLLLDAEDYMKFIGKRKIKEKYLLLYFPVEPSPRVLEVAKRMAKKNNLRIIEVSRSLKSMFKHKLFVTAGVEDFLNLLYYSEFIFADSFHGVCLSYVFKKSFYAFARAEGKKIKAICETLNLEDRFIDKDTEVNELKHLDYSNFDISKKKTESVDWLTHAIND